MMSVNFKIKDIVSLFIVLLATLVALDGCNVDHTLDAHEYGRIYISIARKNPIKSTINGGLDTAGETYELRAIYGGPGKPKRDITVHFGIAPSLVDSFNTQYFTTYKALPEANYTLDSPTVIIPAGQTYSSQVKVIINGKTGTADGQYLLPVTITGTNSAFQLNKDLKTAYFAVTSRFILPEVKPAGQGTPADPYQIADMSNLKWLMGNSSSWDADFVQTKDLDASVTNKWNDGKGFIPLGNADTTFNGTYDGQGHTITGLFINRPGETYVGFFGYADANSIIRNLELKQVNIAGDADAGALTGINYGKVIKAVASTGTITGGSGDNIGGLIGSNHGSIDSSWAGVAVSATGSHIGGLVGYSKGSGIQNSHATGAVTSKNHEVGGLVGDNYDPVTNCYATGDVHSDDIYAGGLIGINYGDIKNSYATGGISGAGDNGGLIGDSHGLISHCYSTGNVTGSGSHSNGGFVGYLTDGAIEYSYCTGDVQTVGNGSTGALVGYAKDNAPINYCFSTGDATCGQGYVGGLVGDTHSSISNSYSTGDAKTGNDKYAGGLVGQFLNGTIKNCYSIGKASNSTNTAGGLLGNNGGTVTNCYWDTQISGLPGSKGGTGLTTAKMQGAAAQINMAGFDFTNVWQIQTNGYPVLINNHL